MPIHMILYPIPYKNSSFISKNVVYCKYTQYRQSRSAKLHHFAKHKEALENETNTDY